MIIGQKYYKQGDTIPENSLLQYNSNRYLKVIGIQTVPGVNVSLIGPNGNTTTIVIGPAGIYELEVPDSIQIMNIQIANVSILKQTGAYFIFDYVSDEG